MLGLALAVIDDDAVRRRHRGTVCEGAERLVDRLVAAQMRGARREREEVSVRHLALHAVEVVQLATAREREVEGDFAQPGRTTPISSASWP